MKNDLPHPAPSAILKLEWARALINHLRALVEAYCAQKHHAISVVKGDDGLFSLRLTIENSMPIEIPLILGDAIHALRSALDHLATGMAATIGVTQNVYFPFHEVRQNLEVALKKHPIRQASPKTADLILNEVKPYRDGNFLLWAITKLDAIDKHRLLLLTVSLTEVVGVCGHDTVSGTTVEDQRFYVLGDGRVSGFATDSPNFVVTSAGIAKQKIVFGEQLVHLLPIVETLEEMRDIFVDVHNLLVPAFASEQTAT